MTSLIPINAMDLPRFQNSLEKSMGSMKVDNSKEGNGICGAKDKLEDQSKSRKSRKSEEQLDNEIRQIEGIKNFNSNQSLGNICSGLVDTVIEVR